MKTLPAHTHTSARRTRVHTNTHIGHAHARARERTTISYLQHEQHQQSVIFDLVLPMTCNVGYLERVILSLNGHKTSAQRSVTQLAEALVIGKYQILKLVNRQKEKIGSESYPK